jgi:signal transduction histidine kinase
VLTFILERSFTEAESKIESFTNEIRSKDERLMESQRLLQQTIENEKLKSEFFSNISHEFRTPLNILLSNLQLMNHYVKNGDIKSETRNIGKYMGTMKQNCYRLLRLINNLIDITKIDSGYIQPSLRNYDIVREIRDIVLSVSEYAESKKLVLHFYTNMESFVTACDPEKLERIMLNLLSNAVKFTRQDGSITVSVNCSSSAVCVSVSDTGIGIPEDKLSIIFDRFSQVDMSLTKSYEGSGIGLSLVRSLVEMLGGTITVHSEVSKGSEFIVHLPAKLVKAEDGPGYAAVNEGSFAENINIEFSDIPK